MASARGRVSRPWRSRRRDERGASLVEFALILPVFSLLLFGLIDFGMVFSGFISLQNEVNAAARAVAIDDITPACQSDPNPVLCTVKADLSRSLLGTVPGSLQFAVAYPDDSSLQKSRVIVCAEATMRATTGITAPFLDGRTMYASSELMLETNSSVPALTSGDSFSSTGFTCG